MDSPILRPPFLVISLDGRITAGGGGPEIIFCLKQLNWRATSVHAIGGKYRRFPDAAGRVLNQISAILP
jgi:hypothetical protein